MKFTLSHIQLVGRRLCGVIIQMFVRTFWYH